MQRIAVTVNAQEKPHIMLVMHGGAGTITRGSMTSEMEKQYRDTLVGVPHVEIYKE
jgi:hypothetical protein